MTTHETQKARPRAILVGVPLPEMSDEDNEESLTELARLAKTLGYDVVTRLSQRRQSLSGGTVLGEGKLRELAGFTGGRGYVERKPAKKRKAETELEDAPRPVEPELSDLEAVIFDCELTPSQLSNLQNATGVQVLDRTGVIVEIFSQHARTREARLQVEIARLKYLSPRIRFAGRGPADRQGMAGEKSLELDKRKIRDRIAELTEEIEVVQREQAAGRLLRAEQPCVALVGYTNAGKSSLMRALTGSGVLVADKLFATLDTTVRTLAPPTIPRILVSDTVGFIKRLPHDLVASFRSTLEEARNAWLLLYVVDASDPTFRSQLEVTQEVLSEIAADTPSRLVLNKCDKLTSEEMAALRSEYPDAWMLSAKRPEDVASLRLQLVEFFEQGMVEEELFIPYNRPRAMGPVRAQFRVISERNDEHGTYLVVRGHEAELARIRELIAAG